MVRTSPLIAPQQHEEREPDGDERSRGANANRQLRYRRRQRRRLSCYRVDGGDEVLLALLASGRLTEEQALDRRAVERELSDVLAEWARRWRDEKNRYA